MARRLIFAAVAFGLMYFVAILFVDGSALSVVFAIAVGLAVFGLAGETGHSAKPQERLTDELRRSLESVTKDQRVRGPWENISFEWANFTKRWRITGDNLQAIEAVFCEDELIVLMKDVQSWAKAKTDPMPPNPLIRWRGGLDTIDSIEMDSFASFHGENERNDHIISYSSGGRYRRRHPALQYERGGLWYSNRRLSVVFAFTTEGDRVRLFQTFDRDLAIKLQRQVANRLAAWRQKAQAQPVAASEYL